MTYTSTGIASLQVSSFASIAEARLTLEKGIYILTGPPGAGKTIISKLLYSPVAALLMLKRGVDKPGSRVLSYMLPGSDFKSLEGTAEVEVWMERIRIAFSLKDGNPRIDLEPPRVVGSVGDLEMPVLLLSEERVASLRLASRLGPQTVLEVDPATFHLLELSRIYEAGLETRIKFYAQSLGVKKLKLGDTLFVGEVPVSSQSSTVANLALVSIALGVASYSCSEMNSKKLVILDMPEYGLTHEYRVRLVDAISMLLNECRDRVALLVATHDETLYRLMVKRFGDLAPKAYALARVEKGYQLSEWDAHTLPPHIMEGIRLLAGELLG